jgi:DNA-binding protein Fis
MSVPSSELSVLLLVGDAAVQSQFKLAFKDASVTIARDLATLHKELQKHRFDVVVLESRSGQESTTPLAAPIDLSRTLFIKGSREVLKKSLKAIQPFTHPNNAQPNKPRDVSLESYLEMKTEEFVKSMRNGSARNLHPILIAAVERPLIISALRETKGNQLQAADLLGLNRNTLRKKIVDLHIPLKRTQVKASRRS